MGIVAALPFLLNSCGSEEAGGPRVGTVAVVIKDAPAVRLMDADDHIVDNVTEIRLTISRILLKQVFQPDDDLEPDSVWIEVPLKEALVQPFNLLSLTDVAMIAAVGDIPAGLYKEFRLVLDESFEPEPCLVLEGSPELCRPLKVPSETLKLKLDPRLRVPEGGTSSIVLDLVPADVRVHETDGAPEYIMRPVIRVFRPVEDLRIHNEISGIVTDCTDDTLEIALRRGLARVTVHYDDGTPLFADDQNADGEHLPIEGGVSCDALLDRRVEIKLAVLPDGRLFALRVEIEEGDFDESNEFHVSGTLAPDSSLSLKTLSDQYDVVFPQGTVRVEGKLFFFERPTPPDRGILAREIETQLTADPVEHRIGEIDPPDAVLILTDAGGTTYEVSFPARLIKVEGVLMPAANTIVAREVEVFP